MIEMWKSIEGYSNYEVSSLGNVRSVDRNYVDSWGRKYCLKGKPLKTCNQKTKGNYCQVMVTIYDENHKAKRCIVARLVAKAFIPNPDNLPQVNHKDENSLNNCVNNLEWCTAKYNVHYNNLVERKAKKKCRKIKVYDKNMNYIETVNSGIEASKKYKVSRGLISSCCHKKTDFAKGYHFEFA